MRKEIAEPHVQTKTSICHAIREDVFHVVVRKCSARTPGICSHANLVLPRAGRDHLLLEMLWNLLLSLLALLLLDGLLMCVLLLLGQVLLASWSSLLEARLVVRLHLLATFCLGAGLWRLLNWLLSSLLVGQQVSVDDSTASLLRDLLSITLNIIDLVQVLWHKLLSEDLVVNCLSCGNLISIARKTAPLLFLLVLDLLLVKLVETLVDGVILVLSSGNETEKCLLRQDVDILASEEVADVLDIHSQELKGTWVIVLNGLGNIDNEDLVLVVKCVILRQIGMNELADLVHLGHQANHLTVKFSPASIDLLWSTWHDSITETWCSPSLLVAQELHDQDVETEVDRLWTWNLGVIKTAQVTHLLLSPDLDHSSVARLVVTAAETVLSGNITISVLEDQNGGLVNLDGTVEWRWVWVLGGWCSNGQSSVNVGLLSGRQTTVDLRDDTSIDHLQQDHTSAWIQDLLRCGTITLVLLLSPSLLAQSTTTSIETDLRGMLCQASNLVLDTTFRGGDRLCLRILFWKLCSV